MHGVNTGTSNGCIKERLKLESNLVRYLLAPSAWSVVLELQIEHTLQVWSVVSCMPNSQGVVYVFGGFGVRLTLLIINKTGKASAFHLVTKAL